jgi:hypothetical protein
MQLAAASGDGEIDGVVFSEVRECRAHTEMKPSTFPSSSTQTNILSPSLALQGSTD